MTWRWRCRACGDTFKSWAAAERHADTEPTRYGGHGARIEVNVRDPRRAPCG